MPSAAAITKRTTTDRATSAVRDAFAELDEVAVAVEDREFAESPGLIGEGTVGVDDALLRELRVERVDAGDVHSARGVLRVRSG